MPLDQAALIGAHVRKLGGVERPELDDLARKALEATRRPVGVDELDMPPAKALVRLEDRPDLDLEPGLLADLSGKRIVESLSGREKAAEALRANPALATELEEKLRAAAAEAAPAPQPTQPEAAA